MKVLSAGVALASSQMTYLVERNNKVFNNNADSSIGMVMKARAKAISQVAMKT